MEKIIAITGAGIAGLATAIGLRKLGHQPMIFEAAPQIKPLGAGLTLAANALKSLEKIGIAGQVRSAGRPIDTLKILDRKGRLISYVQNSNDRTAAAEGILAIHRADLHRVLLDQVPPDSLMTGHKVTGIKQAGNQVVLTFSNGSTFAADRVLAADGIHSPVRMALLPDSRPRYAGYTCWRGVADAGELNLEAATETWSPEGRFGIVPLTGNRIYWFAVVNAPEQDSNLAAWTTADILQHFKHYHDPIPALIRQTPEDRLIHTDICDLKPLSRFQFDRMLLLGDAAHATTPNMGQGACQALQDAAVLTDALEKNHDWDVAFSSFEQRRCSRTRDIVQTSRMLGRVAQWENPFLANIRNNLFRVIPDRIGQQRMNTLLTTDF